MTSWLLITLDSCRLDTYVEASPRCPKLLGAVVRPAVASATWTGPAHYSIASGVLPHPNVTPASSHRTPSLYRGELVYMCEMLGLPVAALGTFAPSLWLPTWFAGLGYHVASSVSMPVLNARTVFGHGWHAYNAAQSFNDAGEHVDWVRGYVERRQRQGAPWFALVNMGDTHYPYLRHGQRDPDDPHLSGLHGVAKGLRDGIGSRVSPPDVSTLISSRLPVWRARQVDRVCDVDAMLFDMIRSLPSGTRVTITADHGEAFGEDGWFGHGPVAHPIVQTVPFVDGFVP